MQGNKKKILEFAVIAVVAIALCLAVAWAFGKEDSKEIGGWTEEEIRLVSILENIDGVGEAEVMIGLTEDGERRVVVVCDGANRISVLMDVREAAANALGIEEKFVKVYLKNK